MRSRDIWLLTPGYVWSTTRHPYGFPVLSVCVCLSTHSSTHVCTNTCTHTHLHLYNPHRCDVEHYFHQRTAPLMIHSRSLAGGLCDGHVHDSQSICLLQRRRGLYPKPPLAAAFMCSLSIPYSLRPLSPPFPLHLVPYYNRLDRTCATSAARLSRTSTSSNGT